MHGLNLMAVAVGLGADAMSVSAAVAVRWHGPRQVLRMAVGMGLFQFAMPVFGWLAGRQLAGMLAEAGCHIAAGLIVLVGAKMAYEALKTGPGGPEEHAAEWEARHTRSHDPTRGLSLLVLSVATSLDALAVGVSLGIAGRQIFLASTVIGLVAATMVVVGMSIGRHLGRRFGQAAELLGAVVLIALGAAFFWM